MNKTELYEALLALVNDPEGKSYNQGAKIGRDTATIYFDQDGNPNCPEAMALRQKLMELGATSPDEFVQEYEVFGITLFFDEDNELHIY